MISIANFSTATAAGASTTIASPATALGAGHLNVVAIRRQATATSVISVTDTAGNSYRPSGAEQHTGASGVAIWYAFNTLANGANIVTATFNSATTRSIITVEVAGVQTTFPQDTWNISASTTSATPTTGALTTATAAEVALVFGSNDASGGTWSASAGYTLITQDPSNYQGVAYQVFSTVQTGLTPSITSTDSTNHKVAVAITFAASLPLTTYGPGTIIVPDANGNNGLFGVAVGVSAGSTLASHLPLGALGGNGAGECGAQLSNGTFLVPAKATANGLITSISIYNTALTLLSNASPFSSANWDVFSPMASDFTGLFWVSKVNTTPAATQVVSLTPGGTVGGTTFVLDDAAGPVVESMAVSQDNSTLYYTLRTNGGGIKKWNLLTNASGGFLVAAGGTAFFNQDLIVVPGSQSVVAIVQPSGGGTTTWQLRRYSTVNGLLLANFAIPGNIGNFTGPEMALDLGNPSGDVWIRGYPDGTGATTQFLRMSLIDGSVLTSFSVAMNNGGIGGGNPQSVPNSCPFFSWSPPAPVPTTVGTRQTVPIRRIRRTAQMNDELLWLFFSEFQLMLQPGVGNANPPGEDPKVGLRWSNDGGHTWSNLRWVSVGAIGQYGTRAIWRMLGRARNRVWEVQVADPVFWAIVDAFAEVSEQPKS